MEIINLRLSFSLMVIFFIGGCAATSAAYSYQADLAETQTQTRQSSPASPAVDAGADTSVVQDNPSAIASRVIYTAELGLRVDRVDVVQENAQRLVQMRGGYVGESGPGKLVLRVPAEVFEPALEELALLGEVIDRRVQAQDASERVVDFESRLRSAQILRERLIELVKGAQNLEHALKVEQELARVTEQIELIEGRLRLVRQQIAYATITLTITPTPEEQRLTPGIPIVWVRELGAVFRERATIDVTTPRRLRDGVNVDMPEGFIRYYQEGYVTQAIDANGVRIRVRRLDNFDGGSLRFWEQIILRSLRDNGGLDLKDPTEIAFERGEWGRLITGQKQIAGETVRYLIAIGVEGERVYAIEAWGVGEHFNAAESDIMKAISTMRCY